MFTGSLVFITDPDKLTDKVSNRTRVFFGVLSLLISVAVIALSLFSQDSVAITMSFIAGIPLFLISLSLLFGKGKKGQGIFSSMTLYVIGTVVGVLSVFFVLKDNDVYWAGFLVAFGCYALAKKRHK
jgi:hypothetical protein